MEPVTPEAGCGCEEMLPGAELWKWSWKMGWKKRRGHNCTEEKAQRNSPWQEQSPLAGQSGELGHVKLVCVAEKKEISVLGATGTLVIYHTWWLNPQKVQLHMEGERSRGKGAAFGHVGLRDHFPWVARPELPHDGSPLLVSPQWRFRWTSWLPQVPGELEHLCRLPYPLVSFESSEIRVAEFLKNKKGSTKPKLALLMIQWLTDLKEIVVLLAWIG